MPDHLLAIDQGTTSTRAICFRDDGAPAALAQREFTQYYPRDGWVEHAPEEIWESTVAVCRETLRQAGLSPREIAGIGITNQRETTLLWDRRTGVPLHPAIVWQDRRTAQRCSDLRRNGWDQPIRERTGLLADPYFSATKLAWLLDNVPGARQRAENGDLAFGTVDTFLLWRLTQGQAHRTDATNAARTMLFNIHTQQWDKDLLDELRIPPSLLPEVCDSSADFGTTAPGILGGGIRIGGIAGDQQAALIGQVGFTPGTAKSTYGTGCFLILNTGNTPVESAQRLLTTVAYRLNGTATYALEGSIFTAGAAVKWLRDKLGLIRSAHETEAMAARAGNHDSLFLVPAFTGLGAPYWDPDARAALVGMTLDTDADQIVAATLRSVAYQTRDLLEAIGRDGAALTELRVDGGMAANNGFLQTLSDITGVPVRRPGCTETTALGAAYLAGLQAGVYEAPAQLAEHWTCDRSFVPTLDGARRDSLYKGWQGAVQRVLSPPREHSAS